MTSPRDSRPLWLVANSASGSNSDEALDELLAALANAGTPVARRFDVIDRLPDRQMLQAAGVGTLAVFTGDGTVNAVATGVEGWDGALLVLPGGTANLLARAIHGDRDAAAIARDFRTLRIARRNCVRSRHGTGLIEILAGPGATWSDVREGLRDGDVGAVAGKAVEAIRQSTVGSMVALADPPIGRAEGYAGVRLDISGEAMLVEGYGAETVGDYFRQGLALLRRNFRDGPHDELGAHPAVTCRSVDSEPIPLMIDGERRDGAAQEHFSLAPFDLDLLAP